MIHRGLYIVYLCSIALTTGTEKSNQVALGTDDSITEKDVEKQYSQSTVAPFPLRLVCYYTNWSQYREPTVAFTPANIDPFLCTHIIYAFAKIDVNYTLAAYEWNDESTAWSKGNFEKFTDLKKQNPHLKCLLSVGGASHPLEKFSGVAATPATRQKFIENVIVYLRERNFDGVDIDWEYPAAEGNSPGEKQRFAYLLQEFSEAFDVEALRTNQTRLILSVVGAVSEETIAKSYDIALVSKAVDFINILTYAFHGSWASVTGHPSALYASEDDTLYNARLVVDYAVDLWIQGGCPAHKINLGMATYGSTFSLSSSLHSIGAPINGPAPMGKYTTQMGVLAYYEICVRLQNDNYTREYDEERQVPYAYGNDIWIGYDDEQSLIYKVLYVKSGGLGGAMVWAMDMDDFTGRFCNRMPWPLLGTIRAALNGTIYPSTNAPSIASSTTTTLTYRLQILNTTKTPTHASPIDSKDNKLTLAAKITLIVSSVFIVLLVTATVVWWCHRRRRVTRDVDILEITLSNMKKGDYFDSNIKEEPAISDPKEYPRSRFVLKEELGCGAFGAVYRAEAVGLMGKDAFTVAVKMLKEPASPCARSDFLKELYLNKMLEPHPNVIGMIGYCTLEEPMYLILEYAPNGNLKCHLDRLRTDEKRNDVIGADADVHGTMMTSSAYDPDKIIKFAYEIACGMEFLSSQDCVHRDLAARNVLLGEGLVCKLGDFGLARDMAGEQQYEMKSGGRVPMRWMAPESILHNIYSSQSDVWSYAVLLWEIVTLGSHPYPGMSSKDIIDSLKQGDRLAKPSHCSSDMYALMLRCWDGEASLRPTFQNIQKQVGQMLEEAEGYLDMSDFNETDFSYLKPGGEIDDTISREIDVTTKGGTIKDEHIMTPAKDNGPPEVCEFRNIDQSVKLRDNDNEDDEKMVVRYVEQPRK